MSDLEQRIAGVLGEHRVKHDSTGGYRGILGGINVGCICGWHGVDHGDADHFRAHVATVLAAAVRDHVTQARAEAWDQGHAVDCARCQMWPDEPEHANPYRADRIASTEDGGR